jgi:hypothetical protein
MICLGYYVMGMLAGMVAGALVGKVFSKRWPWEP